MTIAAATASLNAADTYTGQAKLKGLFNVSISGTWAGTLTLQRSFDDGSTWKDVATYTASAEQVGTETESDVIYRLGFKVGDYTSGTAVVRISQ